MSQGAGCIHKVMILHWDMCFQWMYSEENLVFLCQWNHKLPAEVDYTMVFSLLIKAGIENWNVTNVNGLAVRVFFCFCCCCCFSVFFFSFQKSNKTKEKVVWWLLPDTWVWYLKGGSSGPQFPVMFPFDCWLSVAMSFEFSQEVLNPDFYKQFSLHPNTCLFGSYWQKKFKILCRSNKPHLETGFGPKAASFQLLH